MLHCHSYLGIHCSVPVPGLGVLKLGIMRELFFVNAVGSYLALWPQNHWTSRTLDIVRLTPVPPLAACGPTDLGQLRIRRGLYLSREAHREHRTCGKRGDRRDVSLSRYSKLGRETGHGGKEGQPELRSFSHELDAGVDEAAVARLGRDFRAQLRR